MVAKKDRQLAEARRELEKMKEELAEAEVRTVTSYKNEFSNTLEYLYLTNRFMVANIEQLIERIREVHLEWDLSFIMSTPADTSTLESSVATKVSSPTELQAKGKAHIPPPTVEEDPRCTSP
ncbi:hypothetical protein Adt_18435 [Abeliophyllum distichum]|uniref:Uncharacterized protein n=1 Tax=Abeliophyllum distichum TaxID=126358 RepID=A0ABD1TJC6_9LAMI